MGQTRVQEPFKLLDSATIVSTFNSLDRAVPLPFSYSFWIHLATLDLHITSDTLSKSTLSTLRRLELQTQSAASLKRDQPSES